MMTSKAETLAVTGVLLALSAAVMETRRALELLALQEKDEFAKHVDASNAASEECLQQIRKLLDLIEKRVE
jgi:hypothetical protein